MLNHFLNISFNYALNRFKLVLNCSQLIEWKKTQIWHRNNPSNLFSKFNFEHKNLKSRIFWTPWNFWSKSPIKSKLGKWDLKRFLTQIWKSRAQILSKSPFSNEFQSIFLAEFCMIFFFIKSFFKKTIKCMK